MKKSNENDLLLPVYVTGNRPCVGGRSVAGIKIPKEFILIPAELPAELKDFSAVQFWVAKKRKWIFQKKHYLMAKFILPSGTKSKFVGTAFVQATAEFWRFVDSYYKK